MQDKLVINICKIRIEYKNSLKEMNLFRELSQILYAKTDYSAAASATGASSAGVASSVAGASASTLAAASAAFFSATFLAIS